MCKALYAESNPKRLPLIRFKILLASSLYLLPSASAAPNPASFGIKPISTK